MRADIDELEGFIRTLGAIPASHDLIIPLPAADMTVKIHDQDILFHRATVISSKVALQRLSEGNGIRDDHVLFALNDFLQRGMLFQGLDESVAE